MIRSQSHTPPQWLFWLLQILGWGGLWAFYMITIALSGVDAPGAASGLALTYGSGFLASSLLRLVYRRISRTPRPLIVLVGTIVGLSIAAAQVWFLIGALAGRVIFGAAKVAGDLAWSEYLMAFSVQGTTLLIWSVLYFAVKFWMGWRLQKERAEQADHLAHRAQLQMLRYQLNPHFLFNALNSIRALIDEDKESAKQMVTELSKFLRYSLLDKDAVDVPLGDELNALRNYFAIQKIRYENRLEIVFDVQPDANAFIVPAFLLHPLAENAVKYGMQSSEVPLRVRIEARVARDGLTIVVANSGSWISPSSDSGQSTGTGLDNVRQRLINSFPGRHRLEIEREGGWVRIIMTIRQEGAAPHE